MQFFCSQVENKVESHPFKCKQNVLFLIRSIMDLDMFSISVIDFHFDQRLKEENKMPSEKTTVGRVAVLYRNKNEDLKGSGSTVMVG